MFVSPTFGVEKSSIQPSIFKYKKTIDLSAVRFVG